MQNTPVYLIAGAHTEAGWELVQSLMNRNCRLVLLTRNPGLERRLTAHATGRGDHFMVFRMDPSRARWLKLVMRKVRDAWGTIDSIISFSDFSGGTSIGSLSHHQFQLQLKRNLFAPAALIHAALPIASKNPLLIFAGSAADLSPGSCVSLDGLKGLVRSLRTELPQANVQLIEQGGQTEPVRISGEIVELLDLHIGGGGR